MTLEQYLGASVRSRDKDLAIALEKWRKFRDVATKQPQLLHCLSFAQRVSWCMLRHWWLGTHQEPSLLKAARALFSTQRLVKVGTFNLPGSILPPTTTVDWIVW